MTFLQPYILWGLPLVLLPVIIHLLNRLRHRTQPWAAMRFLVSATRTSVSRARLRQLLVLFFRVLAVLALILFLSRPLAGGWLGWAVAQAPDAILILLDRSASMETRVGSTGRTRREQALDLIADAAKEFQGASHLVLIESARRAPQQLANAGSLFELSLTAPTDTAADLPAMLQSALNWLLEHHAGTAEIWIASDLQRSNWQPDDPRWAKLVGQLASLPQRVRVRLLAFGPDEAANTAVAIREVSRRERGDLAELQFVLDVERTSRSGEPVPLTLTLDGARAQVEVPMDGQSMRWRYRRELGAKASAGWGRFELPADANARDNTACFVYGAQAALRASVVAADAESARCFRFAAAAPGKESRQPADLLPRSAVESVSLSANTLVIWQDLLPEGGVADQLRDFVEQGGVVIFFPTGQTEARRFNGLGWGATQSAEAGGAFRILRWDEEQGPLAKTDEGLSLPLTQTSFVRRQLIVGPKAVLAAFDDGTPFLTRQKLGRGEVFFCASLPNAEWSSLADGVVLVPMLQRLLQAGAKRLQQVTMAEVGELSATDLARPWASVDGLTTQDHHTQAGVYRAGERLIALNRPAAEDAPELVEPAEARRLFGALPFQMMADPTAQNASLQGEVWRLFLFAMLAFLLVESALILPPRTGRGARGLPAAARAGTAVKEAELVK